MTVITGPCARVASVSGLHATVSARSLFLRHYCLVPDTFSALFVDHAMLIPYVEVRRMTLSRIEPQKKSCVVADLTADVCGRIPG